MIVMIVMVMMVIIVMVVKMVVMKAATGIFQLWIFLLGSLM